MLQPIIENVTTYLANNRRFKQAISILERTCGLKLDVEPRFNKYLIGDLIRYTSNPLDILLRHQLSENECKDHALASSTCYGHLDCVEYFVNLGADIHMDNDHALSLAAHNGYLDVVKFLVNCGANLHAIDDLALYWSVEAGHLDVVKFLCDNGANIYAVSNGIFRKAIKYNHQDILRYLVTQHFKNRNLRYLSQEQLDNLPIEEIKDIAKARYQ